jgi:hypothetical protein
LKARDRDPTPAERIDLLERCLREIVALAENHPANPELQHAKVIARAGLRSG